MRSPRDLDALVARLTLEEKAPLTAGRDAWSTAPVERLGIRRCGSPTGRTARAAPRCPAPARRPRSASRAAPRSAPRGTPSSLERVGGAARRARPAPRRAACCSRPTVNLHRSPLAGRNFECYSEDPLLSGKLAAAFVRGVQSQGVATTVKHFAGNEAEFERNTIELGHRRADAARALPPAVRARRPRGRRARDHDVVQPPQRPLLHRGRTRCCTGILRDEWGFDGFVVTDWFAVGRRRLAARRGPRPRDARARPRFFGAALGRGGPRRRRSTRRLLDAAVPAAARRARPHRRARRPAPQVRAAAIDRPEHRALAREAAAGVDGAAHATTACCRSTAQALETLAVIGPERRAGADHGRRLGRARPHYRISPLEALREPARRRRRDRARARDATSTSTVSRPSSRAGRFAHRAVRGPDFDGELVLAGRAPTTAGVMCLSGADRPRAARTRSRSAPRRGSCRPSDGHARLSSCTGRRGPRCSSTARSSSTASPTRRRAATTFFGVGQRGAHRRGRARAPAAPVELVVEFVEHRAPARSQGVKVGCRPRRRRRPARPRRRRRGRTADAVVVVVGTNNDWETEGHDRASTRPARRAGRAHRPRARAPTRRTVVVVNAGAPVDACRGPTTAPAVLQAWFGGQEMANALVDVLFGDAEPGGRLPHDVPRCALEHNAVVRQLPRRARPDPLRRGRADGLPLVRGAAPRRALPVRPRPVVHDVRRSASRRRRRPTFARRRSARRSPCRSRTPATGAGARSCSATSRRRRRASCARRRS